jgi:hypothetical protein
VSAASIAASQPPSTARASRGEPAAAPGAAIPVGALAVCALLLSGVWRERRTL